MGEPFNVNTPGIATPSIGQGLLPVIIDDIVEAREHLQSLMAGRAGPGYTNGCVIHIHRPGELEPAVPPIHIPQGSILCFIDPETATRVRPELRQMCKNLRDKITRERQRHAEMGHRG